MVPEISRINLDDMENEKISDHTEPIRELDQKFVDHIYCQRHSAKSDRNIEAGVSNAAHQAHVQHRSRLQSPRKNTDICGTSLCTSVIRPNTFLLSLSPTFKLNALNRLLLLLLL